MEYAWKGAQKWQQVSNVIYKDGMGFALDRIILFFQKIHINQVISYTS